jgi:acyl-CoA synthetase (AMP-forming)/AMP-acid ligase II
VPAASGLPSTLVELLRFRSLHQGDKRAYTFLAEGEREVSRLTYRELDGRARALAAKLLQSYPQGERAILLYPPGLEFIVGFLGCLYAGVVAVPAYLPRPNRSLSRLQAILSDAQASIALTTTSILSNIALHFPHAPELASLGWVATDAVEENLADAWRHPKLSADTLAFLQYTSGSTASPKGVMVSHGNVLHNERMIQEAFEHTENTVFVSWLPLFHDMGLIGNMLQPIYLGASSVLMSPTAFLQRPISWLAAITRYRATTAGGPNFGYALCAQKITPEERSGLDLSSWTVAFNGAEPIRHKTLEQFAKAFGPCGFRREAFFPCYGLAEATLFVSGGPRGRGPETFSMAGGNLEQPPAGNNGKLLVGCGPSWMGQRIAIVDPDTCSLLPDNEVGEIWVSGPSVAQGYWNRPEETEHTFRAYLARSREGPFLRTGDLGFLKDGELVVTGRIKDLIIIRGRNIYPQDIEQTVETCHPALRPGCGGAFRVETADEERLVVVQEVDPRRRPDLDEVAGAIRQAVAEQHEVPVYDVVLIKPGAFPKTSSGKLQRRACKDDYLAGSLTGVLLWRGKPSTGLQVKSADLRSEPTAEVCSKAT